jgi:hypothetical protein
MNSPVRNSRNIENYNGLPSYLVTSPGFKKTSFERKREMEEDSNLV